MQFIATHLLWWLTTFLVCTVIIVWTYFRNVRNADTIGPLAGWLSYSIPLGIIAFIALILLIIGTMSAHITFH